jgi:tetratricopeptide (TPR) repeat protein
MDSISAILTSLSSVELKHLDRYIDGLAANKDGKDRQLLSILKKDEDLQPDAIIRELYSLTPETTIPANKRNSYHQWRSILSEQLDDFIVQLIDSGDTSQYIVKLILVARFLLLRKKYKVAFRYLQKAEAIALKIDRYELLQRIYSLQIDYVWSQPDMELEPLLTKWKQNMELEHKESTVNTVLGILKKRLKDLQYKSDAVNFEEMITGVLQEYNIRGEQELSVANQYRITKIVEFALVERQEHFRLMAYLIDTFEKMDSADLFTVNNRFIKLKFLSRIVYFSIKCLQLKIAGEYLNLLEKEEKNDDRQSGFKGFQRTFSAAGFFVFTGKLPEAIELLNKTLHNAQAKAILNEDDYHFAIFYSNLFGFNFFHGDYSTAQKAMSKLLNNEQRVKNSNGYKSVFCLHVVDCFLQIEKGDTEYALGKLTALQKRFRIFLVQEENSYYKEVVEILRQMIMKPEILASSAFAARIHECIKDKQMLLVKYEIIPFNIYLLSKIKKRPVYSLMLESIPGD